MNSREQVSKNGKFHGVLATQNIPEAIAYYNIFREQYPSLNVVALFDSNIDNSDGGIIKEDALLEMLGDYNQKYQTTFQLSTYGKYKKDVAKRLAHKKPYIGIEHDHDQQIDLLIVVTQMLTGYDSKWVNTLYVDKLMSYVDLIQSFSRTNHLFGPDKPFGIIRYYAFPYTMEQNIQNALEVYVDRPLGVFVDKLEGNLANINQRFLHIRDIFRSHEIPNFERLPDTREDRNMFAKDFSQMTHLLEAAKLQGFLWEKSEYEFQHGDTYTHVKMELDEQTYLTLLQRYRKLFEGRQTGGGSENDFDYPIDTYITETGTGTIDAEYINSKFVKFIKNLYTSGPGSEFTKEALKELHKTFATLSQKEQRTATVILHDIQCGDLHLSPGKTIYDYITEYQLRELHKQIMVLAEATGLNASQLEHILNRGVNEQNLNEFNQFEDLKLTLNQVKTREFIARVEGAEVPSRLVIPKADQILRDFILDAGSRERILKAYLGDGEKFTPAEQTSSAQQAEGTADNTQPAESDQTLHIEKVKSKIDEILFTTLSDIAHTMRPANEVLNSVFYVIEKKSVDSLDNVGIFIKSALTNLYGKKATIVDKFVAFNLLVTKFEAYLKKLYYLMHGKEIQPQKAGDNATWKDVIHAHTCLWDLKNSSNSAKQQLYRYLLLVKGWRNTESHISPTASEQEVDTAIHIIITMYFYATGSSITDLEMAGHDVNEATPDDTEPSGSITTNDAPRLYAIHTGEEYSSMVAEPVNIKDLSEPKRIEIFKKCIIQLFGYNPRRSVFSKQRHWESIYRIAADFGFVIDGDYAYFKNMIDKMQLNNLPAALTHDFLDKANTGIYAQSYDEWTSVGLTGRKFREYEDIRQCAEAFKKIVEENIPKKNK